MIIRKAILEDEQKLIELYGLFVQNPARYETGGHSFKEFLASETNYVFVAEIESKLVGFIAFTKRTVVRYPKPIMEVEELFVLEQHRKQGLASNLFERAIAFAKDCHYIFVASGNEWTNAHKLYEKLGFDRYSLHFRRKP